MHEYIIGNTIILQMINSTFFDVAIADKQLHGVDLNEPIIVDSIVHYTTTYLYESVSANNTQAVKYFLEHGANPNYDNPALICDCPLWELQYIEDGQSVEERYEIEKLFFKYGADPNHMCDNEGLYDYVRYKVYNDTPVSKADWSNLLQLYKLLIIYGGGEVEHGNEKPVADNIDISKVDDYDVELYKCDDGYHIGGHLIDKDGTVLLEL